MISLSGCVLLCYLQRCYGWIADEIWDLCMSEWKSWMLRATEGKGKSNIQVWGSSESAFGQSRLHGCLQGSEERAAGRFIRGGSGKPLPKLSLALMGWFSLSTLPASLALDPYQRRKAPHLIRAQTPMLDQPVLF